MYYPYMASIVGKRRGTATYYYLVESARVDGKPRIVSQEYLGTADELAAAMRAAAGPAGRDPAQGVRAVAAAWGMLEDLGVARIIDEVAGRGRPASRCPPDVPGAGGTEPAGRAVLEGRVRGLVEEHRRRPVRQDPGAALDHRRFWDAMHAVTPGQLGRSPGRSR